MMVGLDHIPLILSSHSLSRLQLESGQGLLRVFSQYH